MIGQAFLVGVLASFIGSVGPGMIVIYTWAMSIQKGRTAALYFALGATLIEVVYATLVLQLNFLVQHTSIFEPYVYGLAGLCMLFLAYRAYATAETTTAPPIMYDKRRRMNPLRKGLVFGLINLLPIPFWIAVTLYLQDIGWLYFGTIYTLWGYVVGIGVGTWSLLCLVAHVSARLSRLKWQRQGRTSVLTWVYLAAACYLFYRALFT